MVRIRIVHFQVRRHFVTEDSETPENLVYPEDPDAHENPQDSESLKDPESPWASEHYDAP